MTEAEMVQDIEGRLLSIGISCLREVPLVDNTGWIDLALRRGRYIAAIECKLSGNGWRRALRQAVKRQCFGADEAWICTPFLYGIGEPCRAACAANNVGILRYRPKGTWPFDILLSAGPLKWRWEGFSRTRWHDELLEKYEAMERASGCRPLRARLNGIRAGMVMNRVVIANAPLRKGRGVVHRLGANPDVPICGASVGRRAVFMPVSHMMYRASAPPLVNCKRCEKVWAVNRNAYYVEVQRRNL